MEHWAKMGQVSFHLIDDIYRVDCHTCETSVLF